MKLQQTGVEGRMYKSLKSYFSTKKQESAWIVSTEACCPSRRSTDTHFLSVTSHINCIVARCLINVVYLTACCLYQVMMTLHFLSDVAYDAESTENQKLRHYR